MNTFLSASIQFGLKRCCIFSFFRKIVWCAGCFLLMLTSFTLVMVATVNFLFFYTCVDCIQGSQLAAIIENWWLWQTWIHIFLLKLVKCQRSIHYFSLFWIIVIDKKKKNGTGKQLSTEKSQTFADQNVAFWCKIILFWYNMKFNKMMISKSSLYDCICSLIEVPQCFWRWNNIMNILSLGCS